MSAAGLLRIGARSRASSNIHVNGAPRGAAGAHASQRFACGDPRPPAPAPRPPNGLKAQQRDAHGSTDKSFASSDNYFTAGPRSPVTTTLQRGRGVEHGAQELRVQRAERRSRARARVQSKRRRRAARARGAAPECHGAHRTARRAACGERAEPRAARDTPHVSDGAVAGGDESRAIGRYRQRAHRAGMALDGAGPRLGAAGAGAAAQAAPRAVVPARAAQEDATRRVPHLDRAVGSAGEQQSARRERHAVDESRRARPGLRASASARARGQAWQARG